MVTMVAPRAYTKLPLEVTALLPDGTTNLFNLSHGGIWSPLTGVVVAGTVDNFDVIYDPGGRPWVAYVRDGSGYLYWVDTRLNTYVTLFMGLASQAFISIRDPAVWFSLASLTTDTVVHYVHDSVIYRRTSQDNFTEALVIGTLGTGEFIRNTGLTSNGVLQLIIGGAAHTAGAFLTEYPYKDDMPYDDTRLPYRPGDDAMFSPDKKRRWKG